MLALQIPATTTTAYLDHQSLSYPTSWHVCEQCAICMWCFDDLLDEWKLVLRSDTSFGVLWCCSLVTFIALAIGLVNIQNIEVQYYWPHNIATLLNTETFHFWTHTHTCIAYVYVRLKFFARKVNMFTLSGFSRVLNDDTICPDELNSLSEEELVVHMHKLSTSVS